MKKIIAFLSILLPLLLIGCNQPATPDGNPRWVQNLITAYEKDSCWESTTVHLAV